MQKIDYKPFSRNGYYDLAWKTKDFRSLTFDVASVENECLSKAMEESNSNNVDISFNYKLICLDPLPIFYLAISYALVAISIWNRSLDRSSAINIVFLYSFVTFILSNSFVLNNNNNDVVDKSKLKSI
jgi:hypothetical protein